MEYLRHILATKWYLGLPEQKWETNPWFVIRFTMKVANWGGYSYFWRSTIRESYRLPLKQVEEIVQFCGTFEWREAHTTPDVMITSECFTGTVRVAGNEIWGNRTNRWCQHPARSLVVPIGPLTLPGFSSSIQSHSLASLISGQLSRLHSYFMGIKRQIHKGPFEWILLEHFCRSNPWFCCLTFIPCCWRVNPQSSIMKSQVFEG